MFYSTVTQSPLGQLTLAASERAIIGLWLDGQKYWGQTLPTALENGDELPILRDGKQWLDDYFAGKPPRIGELPLAPIGGAFRQLVWQLLTEIPYGQVTTYGELADKAAKRLGKTRMSAQAVGGAVAHNQISIIIPCHRAVGTGGSLTGYAGGLDKKIALLKREGVDMSRLFVPQKGTAL